MLDAEIAENTSRFQMHIKNSLRRETKLPEDITVTIEQLETKTLAVPCTGSRRTNGSYTVIKAPIKQVRLCLLPKPRPDRCSFYPFHFWLRAPKRRLLPGVPTCILPEGLFWGPWQDLLRASNILGRVILCS